MKEINGKKYSFKEFDPYKLRIKMEYIVSNAIHSVDIYTEEEDINIAYEGIMDILKDKPYQFEMVNYSTKEQDDLDREFINKFLDF